MKNKERKGLVKKGGGDLKFKFFIRYEFCDKTQKSNVKINRKKNQFFASLYNLF